MTTAALTVIEPREVPLGGPRAMNVRRLLPHRERSFVGAWCFLDHYGPDDVSLTGGMDVPPHPHTGLQTVSWLFSGEIEHRDSGGVVGLVLPGEMNLMTSGAGICHSEVSTPNTTLLHGVQLWVALPEEARHGERAFQHFAPEAVTLPGASVKVFVGSLVGVRSPVEAATPLLGAELLLDAGATIDLDVEAGFEHGLLVDAGCVTLAGQALPTGAFGIVDAGPSTLTITNTGDDPARLVLLGGAPFEESIVMWWNFVGRSHEEIEAFRASWQARSDQFGVVDGYTGDVQHLPAPELPNSRLTARGRRGRTRD